MARRPARPPRLAVCRLEDRTAPATFTVTSSAEAGPGSLWQAIMDSNASVGARDTIQFAVTGVIDLLAALPALTDGVDITGPGASLLAVERTASQDYRIFTVAAGTTATISGLTIAGGNVVGHGGRAGPGHRPPRSGEHGQRDDGPERDGESEDARPIRWPLVHRVHFNPCRAVGIPHASSSVRSTANAGNLSRHRRPAVRANPSGWYHAAGPVGPPPAAPAGLSGSGSPTGVMRRVSLIPKG
jgi:hypothetical protein